MGNVSPRTLLGGDPETVRAEAAAAARDGQGTPKGFVLSTGCELPIRTPPENVLAFMESAGVSS